MQGGEHVVGAVSSAATAAASGGVTNVPVPRRKPKRGRRAGVGRVGVPTPASDVSLAATAASAMMQARAQSLSVPSSTAYSKEFVTRSQGQSVGAVPGSILPSSSVLASSQFGVVPLGTGLSKSSSNNAYALHPRTEAYASDPAGKFSVLMPEERAAAFEYDQFLSELTFNSKDVINNLTKIAGENVASFNAIAFAVELRIITAPPHARLPLMYVIDSICKNIGGVYIPRFKQGVHRCFMCVYESADASVRESMFRMLNTWPSVFGPELVESIRQQVNVMNSMAPSDLMRSMPGAHTAYGVGAPPVSNLYSGTFQYNVLSHIDRLYADFTSKLAAGIHPSVLDSNTLSTLISGQLQNVSLSPFERNKYLAMQRRVQSFAPGFPTVSTSVSPFPGNGPLASQHVPPVASAPSLVGLQFPAQAPPQSNALTAIPIPRTASSVLRTVPEPQGKRVLEYSALKSISHADVVRTLYTELPYLSKSDGMRFKTQNELRDHLDWIFDQNKRKRARQRVIGGSGVSRCWYDRTGVFLDKTVTSTLVSTGASVGVESKGSAGNTIQSATASKTNQDFAQPNAQADVVDRGSFNAVVCEAIGDNETCPVCLEEFQIHWDDDRQAWMLQDGIRSEIDGKAYHSGCIESTDADGDEYRAEEDDEQSNAVSSTGESDVISCNVPSVSQQENHNSDAPAVVGNRGVKRSHAELSS